MMKYESASKQGPYTAIMYTRGGGTPGGNMSHGDDSAYGQTNHPS